MTKSQLNETYHIKSDWDLIVACQQGDELAWSTFIARYDRLLYYILDQYHLPPEEIADIVQNSFISLLDKLDGFNESYNFKAWLKTVAKRQAWRYLENRRREDVGSDENASDSIIPDYMDKDAIDRNKQKMQLHEGVLSLNERCKRLLIHLYFDDPTPPYEEIAEELGMPLGSIGPTRARCLKKLRQIIESNE